MTALRGFPDTPHERRASRVFPAQEPDPPGSEPERKSHLDLQLSDRVAVVTGASKGIGLATTRALLAEGAHVVAVSRTTGEELDALKSESLVHVSADLMKPDAPAYAVERAHAEFGGLDILVNNAGGPPPGAVLPRFSFLEPADDDWQAMFELNLFATVRACRAAIPLMLERGSGAVVNVSSGNARQPGPMNADYAAAKAAMNNLTMTLSEEFAAQGIRVNTVSPGPVRTPWWTDDGGAADVIARHTGSDRESVLETLAPQLMNLTTGRLVRPDEVAAVIALLASPRSASTTGSDYVVDGGLVKAV